MKGIADTGFLVAFANRNDDHHGWAVALARDLTEPFLTCEAVLAAAAFHLRNTAVVLDMIKEGLVVPAFDVNANLARLGDLSRRYADRKPDLADLCVIRMSELHPDHKVVTIDRADFRVYRRNGREAIPVALPPDPARR